MEETPPADEADICIEDTWVGGMYSGPSMLGLTGPFEALSVRPADAGRDEDDDGRPVGVDLETLLAPTPLVGEGVASGICWPVE